MAGRLEVEVVELVTEQAAGVAAEQAAGVAAPPAGVPVAGVPVVGVPVVAVPVVAVPVLAGEAGPTAIEGTPAAFGFDAGALVARGFRAKVGQAVVTGGSGGAPVVVYLGLGDAGHTGPGPAEAAGGAPGQSAEGAPGRVAGEVLRRAGAALVRSSGEHTSAYLVVPHALSAMAGGPAQVAAALVEGVGLAAYRFDAHKSTPTVPPLPPLPPVPTAPPTAPTPPDGGESGSRSAPFTRLVLGVEAAQAAAARAGAARGRRIAEAVCLARDWVNEPPSRLVPSRLAELAEAELSGVPGVSFEAWDLERIAEERLGGLLGVARGSAEEPRLVRARYEPADPLEVEGRVPHVVLVGKGITFDSGGLSLKSASGMEAMKTDMSGVAAVLAAVSACSDLGVRVRVSAVAALSENMPGGRATKPGDVLVTRSGRTIEVLNTDAEGRLVLADALTLAAEDSPDAIVDLATLTGACVTALGTQIAGLFANDDLLARRVVAAAERSGEEVWRLPLPEAYRDHIDSDVADMKNVGKAGEAGAIAAAMLLERFVAGRPWVHLDIAGPARSRESSGYLAKGGTGFGVRLLLELLSAWPEGDGASSGNGAVGGNRAAGPADG